VRSISIDPGLTGGVVFWEDLVPVRWEKMPVSQMVTRRTPESSLDAVLLAKWFKEFKPDLAIIEYAASRPNQASSATFSTGYNYGILASIIAHVPSVRIAVPAVWVPAVHLLAGLAIDPGLKLKPDERRKITKTHSSLTFEHLFPNIDILTPRSKKRHEGIVDAMLLGYWALTTEEKPVKVKKPKKKKVKEPKIKELT
jgi:hypothetical protein